MKAIWVIASSGPSSGGEITRSYLIEVSFDPNHRISRVRLLKDWGESVTDRPESAPD